MNARLENDLINLYDDNEILIGSLKIKSNFKESELVLNNQTFKLIRDGWKTKIIEDSIEKFNLKTNSLLGNTEVLETGHKITGEWGIKWATKLIDDKENTLLKIRNENSFLDNGKYEI
ncbi:hypothetical protein LY01_00547 [Nonlabens xylanidelens]|uniref:Uncharacterized protein n=1 Tax=Nonlabens xylanidelens TaxID=191564 RepID=A0A2S6IR43_9FLAO|nr:hypothetical protein [Nonlabens xylanidelens]PPK96723.1 hypothetical protein LY01_00547 [Nonlabens xylanidelens]PQJ13435.1 hypothetical protein BST94_13810 [Nonlabens xylanidelens]